MTAFTKPAISISEQLQLWRNRGLIVADTANAEHCWIRMPIVLSDPNVDPHTRLYLLLATLEYILQAVNPSSTWHERLKGLMDRNTQISKAHLGMPNDWADDPFWRL